MSAEPVVATAGDIARQFSRYSDIAQDRAVVVTRDGRATNILLSIQEYERLKKRDQMAFLAADTPELFLTEIEELARGKT